MASRALDLRHGSQLDRRPTLKEALDRVGQAAKSQAPGSWIAVAGAGPRSNLPRSVGPHRRRWPKRLHKIRYIQHLYDWLLLSPKAMEA